MGTWNFSQAMACILAKGNVYRVAWGAAGHTYVKLDEYRGPERQHDTLILHTGTTALEWTPTTADLLATDWVAAP